MFLAQREDRPWSEWKNGRRMTIAQLARQLKAFEIKPKNIRLGEAVLKGYERAQFEDAFHRYLPSQGATTPQPIPDIALQENEAATQTATQEALPLQSGGVADSQQGCSG